jgi:hypothetical protein
MPFDVSGAIEMSSAEDFDRWLRANGGRMTAAGIAALPAYL